MSTLSFDLLDSSFVVTGPAAGLAALTSLLPSAPGAPRPGAVHLHLGPDEPLDELLALLNRTALAQCRSFAVHAAVLTTPYGAIAVPAESGAGKSTLVAACLARGGFGYGSDEALVVDWDSGLVRPYPRWVTLSPWSAAQVGREPGATDRAWTPAELGARVAVEPVPLTDVVLLRRSGGPARLDAVSRVHAARALLACSFNHYQRPAEAFALAAALARGARAWVLHNGPPPESAAVLAAGLLSG